MRSYVLDAIGSRRGPFVACLLLAAAPLAGCSNVDRTVATSAIPGDFHQRHPIVLANARQTLDIFPVGRSGALDFRQGRDIDSFAADYRVHGDGLILAQLPMGAVDGRAAQATLTAIRRALAAAGVKGDIAVGSYRIADPALASPVRLSFTKLQARLASRCGEWPDDLGSGSNLNTWDNRTYYNFGCANQQTLAAQIDDPRDLVRPRAEDPSDVQTRTRAITAIRAGTDPGTSWAGASAPLIGVVGTSGAGQ